MPANEVAVDPAVVEPDPERAIADTIDRMLLWARRRGTNQLSATSVTTLSTLQHGGPLRISELAVREGVSQPGMTTLINRLVEEGYAERYADPTDRRAALVRVTDAGRSVLAERHATRTEALLADLRQLDPEHRAALIDALPALLRLTQLPPSQHRENSDNA